MKKCNHPPGNDFGSVAVTAAVLLRSPEARSYSPAAAQSFSATPEPCSHIHARLGESIRERIVVVGLAVIRSHGFVRSCGRTPGLQTIVTVELQLGVRAAGSAS